MLLAGGLGGCSAIYYLGEEGTNLTDIKADATVSQVDAKLGPPIREWKNERAVTFRLYSYDAGTPADYPKSLTMGLIGLGTMGVTELLFALEKPTPHNRLNAFYRPRVRLWARMIVAFDANGVMIGLFQEFDYLPPAGRL